MGESSKPAETPAVGAAPVAVWQGTFRELQWGRPPRGLTSYYAILGGVLVVWLWCVVTGNVFQHILGPVSIWHLLLILCYWVPYFAFNGPAHPALGAFVEEGFQSRSGKITCQVCDYEIGDIQLPYQQVVQCPECGSATPNAAKEKREPRPQFARVHGAFRWASRFRILCSCFIAFLLVAGVLAFLSERMWPALSEPAMYVAIALAPIPTVLGLASTICARRVWAAFHEEEQKGLKALL